MKYYLGIDIGGTKMAVSLADRSFNILEKSSFLTCETITPDKTLEKFYELIGAILERRNLKMGDIISIGISCGGPLNSKQGVILSPPNLPLWNNVEIVKDLKEKYKVPVFIQNDANACALVEWKLGAGKGLENMIFLTFGTGMGAGLILNGKLYCGKNDMAGEVGHIRLADRGPVGFNKAGSFEGFCSGGGLKQLADIHGLNYRTAKELLQDAQNRNDEALKVVEESATYLGTALSILIDILNPEAIVIGSIYTRCENLFVEKMKEVLKKEALEASLNCCEILPAKMGENIGDLAAIMVATGEY